MEPPLPGRQPAGLCFPQGALLFLRAGFQAIVQLAPWERSPYPGGSSFLQEASGGPSGDCVLCT